ncbi:unnamed protein product [Oikopleura dioica]|uniref:P/Homo B domain-containing protein n=1 Tax=Oikopleura dioica TaxID=34765 RepID=E4XCS8_OIKDI|nr:unnamed protein product [Oikopleura dioica]
MRVLDAWAAGYTGKNVTVSILDDGVEYSHPDLRDNYNAQASTDINDNDNDPVPRYDINHENKHGTRCAGVISAVANNNNCVVGAAFGAKVAGVRMLDGDVTDEVEANSLKFARGVVDIYSASWGPDDDGKKVDGPRLMAQQAFVDGARFGRNGLGVGSIFVWASGNGGHNQDHCSCDGYTNSIYTISVSATTELGNRPWYAESCASTMTTTFSSGEGNEGSIYTTDLNAYCTSEHTGTSASAPFGAAIIALALEANSGLNWRDMQHLVVRASSSSGFVARQKTTEFETNGAGFAVSHVFGFGLLDAYALVTIAKSWRTVPPQKICAIQIIRPRKETRHYINVRRNSCIASNNVRFLEHTILELTIEHSRRGDLEIKLRSPKGTLSTLLERRSFDRSAKGFQKWKFMSVHFWGEDPEGTWVLTILDVPSQRNQQNGFLEEFTLRLHGTSTNPQVGWTMPPLLPKTRQIKGVQREDFHNSMDSSPLNHDCANFHNHNCHEFCTGGCCGALPSQCHFCKHAMSKDGSTCLQQCPYGQFLNSRRQCQICAHPCDHCANQADVCTRCVAGYTSDGRGGCDKQCELGEYTEPETHECRKCHPSCSRCSGPYANECRACSSEFTFLQAGVCNTRCQDGFYPNLSTHVCNKCHDNCKTCTGGSAKDCTSCHYNSLVQNGQCLQTG